MLGNNAVELLKIIRDEVDVLRKRIQVLEKHAHFHTKENEWHASEIELLHKLSKTNTVPCQPNWLPGESPMPQGCLHSWHSDPAADRLKCLWCGNIKDA